MTVELTQCEQDARIEADVRVMSLHSYIRIADDEGVPALFTQLEHVGLDLSVEEIGLSGGDRR